MNSPQNMVPKNENALGKNRLTLGETRVGEIRGRIFNLYDVCSVLLPIVFDLYLLLFWPLTAFIFGRFSADFLVLAVLLVFDCFILLQGVSNFCRRLGTLYQLFNFGARCCPTFFPTFQGRASIGCSSFERSGLHSCSWSSTN